MSNTKSRISSSSDRLLKKFHESLTESYEHDRSMSDEEKEIAMNFRSDTIYYGTDLHKDIPEFVDIIENEMKTRGIEFISIKK